LIFYDEHSIRHIGVVLMALLDTVLNRRSIRRYEKREIAKDVLDKILEAGRQAPSAANKQPWHFIVLTDSEIKKELSRELFNRFIKDAPVTIVGCAHKDLIAGKWSIVSTTIALQNMVIAAWLLLPGLWVSVLVGLETSTKKKSRNYSAFLKAGMLSLLFHLDIPLRNHSPERRSLLKK